MDKKKAGNLTGFARVVSDCRKAMFRPPADRWEREKLFSRVRNYSIRTQYFSWNIAAPLALYLFGDSDLNRFIKDDETHWNVLFHLLQIISMTFYFIASLIDPGYINTVPNNNYDDNHHSSMAEEEVGLLSSNSSVSGNNSPNNSGTTKMVSIEMSSKNINGNNNQNNNGINNNTNNAMTLANNNKKTSIVQGSKNKEPIFINSDNPPGNFCFRCEFIRPIRSKHCYDCDRCVMKFDHHCPMVANCVGGKNHRFFLTFITFETIVVFWAFMMALKTLFKLNLIFSRHHEDDEGEIGGRSPIGWVFRVILFITMFFALFVVAGLAGFHWYLAFTNQTTYEMIKPTLTERYYEDKKLMMKNQIEYKKSRSQLTRPLTNNDVNNNGNTLNSPKNIDNDNSNIMIGNSPGGGDDSRNPITSIMDPTSITMSSPTSNDNKPNTIQYLQQRSNINNRGGLNSDSETKENSLMSNNDIDNLNDSKNNNNNNDNDNKSSSMGAINNSNLNNNNMNNNMNDNNGMMNETHRGDTDSDYYTSDSSVEDFGMRKPGHRPARPGSRHSNSKRVRRRGYRLRNRYEMYFSKGVCSNLLAFFGADLEKEWCQPTPCIIVSK